MEQIQQGLNETISQRNHVFGSVLLSARATHIPQKNYKFSICQSVGHEGCLRQQVHDHVRKQLSASTIQLFVLRAHFGSSHQITVRYGREKSAPLTRKLLVHMVPHGRGRAHAVAALRLNTSNNKCGVTKV